MSIHAVQSVPFSGVSYVAVNVSDKTASTGRKIAGKICKEAVLSWNFLGGAKENHEKSHLRYSMFLLRMELSNYRIKIETSLFSKQNRLGLGKSMKEMEKD
jgi:hypothetical protein